MAEPNPDASATLTTPLQPELPGHASARAVPRLRFTPFRRSDLRRMLREEPAGDPAVSANFEATAARIEEHFAADFHRLRQAIQDRYAPCDPDTDTRSLEAAQDPALTGAASDLGDRLSSLPERANYGKLTEADDALGRLERLALAASDGDNWRLRIAADGAA